MTGKKIFILGLVIFLFIVGGLESVNALTAVTPERSALMLHQEQEAFSRSKFNVYPVGVPYQNLGEIVLSSAPSSEAAQEMASPKTPAVDDTTLTGKMLKGKAVPPAKKEKPYPAPEVKKPEVKDKPYPAPELKKPAGPKNPAVTSPAKTLPAAPVPTPAPTPPPGDSK